MDSSFQGERSRPRYWYRWMLAIPFIWQAALAPAVNDIAARPFGLPFPMFWQMAGIVLAKHRHRTGVLHGSPRKGVEDEEAALPGKDLCVHGRCAMKIAIVLCILLARP